MGMNDWVMLVTALGGIEGIKQLIKWWMSRKTNARIEDAHADVEEFKALPFSSNGTLKSTRTIAL